VKLGNALAAAPAALLEGVRVHTKFGLAAPTIGLVDFTAAETRASFARSLWRFHLDEGGGGRPYRCATLRIHHPPLVSSPGSLAEVTAPDGAIAALVELRAAGKIEVCRVDHFPCRAESTRVLMRAGGAAAARQHGDEHNRGARGRRADGGAAAHGARRHLRLGAAGPCVRLQLRCTVGSIGNHMHLPVRCAVDLL
jgi:hypothetical protein